MQPAAEGVAEVLVGAGGWEVCLCVFSNAVLLCWRWSGRGTVARSKPDSRPVAGAIDRAEQTDSGADKQMQIAPRSS